MGNFGDIEYGTTIRGRVHYPIENQEGCSKFKPEHFDGEHLRQAAEDGHAPVIMVDRGTCKFVEKVKHIQDFGGILAIIVDNVGWEDVNNEVMVSDGTDTGITIPSFLIDKHEGRRVKNHVNGGHPNDDDGEYEETEEEQEDFNNVTHPVILQANINLASKSDKNISVDIWYTSIYEFALQPAMMDLADFAAMQDVFGDKVKFHPRTEIKTCRYCLKDAKEKECILDGKYCPYKIIRGKDEVDLIGGDMEPQELINQMLRE
jgi:hypothetical protein